MLQIGAALLGGSAERSFGQAPLCPPPDPADDSFNGFIAAIYPEDDPSAKELRQAYDLCPGTVLKQYEISKDALEEVVLFESLRRIRNKIDQSTETGKKLFANTNNWGTFLPNEFTFATIDRKLKDKKWGKVCENNWNEPGPQYPMPRARIFVIRDESGSNDKFEGKSEETVRLTIFGQGFVADKTDIKVEFLEHPAGISFPGTVKDISGTYRCGCIEVEAKLPKVLPGLKRMFVVNVEQEVSSKSASATVNLEYSKHKFTVTP
jgi:hypothetical protein